MNFDSSVLNVAIEDIIPNRFQPRLAFDDASLADLAKSIKEHGIIQPLVLRKFGDKYEIVAGERRYKAAQLAGLASVPAVISLIDDKTSAEVAIAENVQRKPLTAIEEAKSYKALLDLGYMSVDQLASKMGISATSLNGKLRLLSLSPEVQDAIMQNKISERHGRSLLIIPTPEDQVVWLHKIMDERLTVRQLDEKLSEIYKGDEKAMNMDFEAIKQNATDIPIAPAVTPDASFIASSPMDLSAPIDLGQKQTGKFFNNLESQAVSMSMTEALNPLASNDGSPNLGFGAPQPMNSSGLSFATVDSATPAPVLGPPTIEEPTVLPSTEAIPSLMATAAPTQMPDAAPVASMEPTLPILPSPSDNSMTTASTAPMQEVESLDSLDFNPPAPAAVAADLGLPNIPDLSTPAAPGALNPQEASSKIAALVEELKNAGYNIQFSNMDMPDQMLINIVLKK